MKSIQPVYLAAIIFTIALHASGQKTSSMKDSRDGKKYRTVKIGNQTWMAENLTYKAASGCWAYDGAPENAETYGYLYTWEAAKTGCPSGWRLPAHDDWKNLADELGGPNEAGSKLMEAGTSHWKSTGRKRPDVVASNESGFTALPGGYRYTDGTFSRIGTNGFWWSSTEYVKGCGEYWDLYCDYKEINTHGDLAETAYSVRCIKE